MVSLTNILGCPAQVLKWFGLVFSSNYLGLSSPGSQVIDLVSFKHFWGYPAQIYLIWFVLKLLGLSSPSSQVIWFGFSYIFLGLSSPDSAVDLWALQPTKSHPVPPSSEQPFSSTPAWIHRFLWQSHLCSLGPYSGHWKTNVHWPIEPPRLAGWPKKLKTLYVLNIFSSGLMDVPQPS